METAVTESLHTTFFMFPLLISWNEVQIQLPCSEQMWSANGPEWRLLQASDRSIEDSRNGSHAPTPTVCSIFARVAAEQSIPSGLGDAGRLALAFAIFTQHTSARDLDSVLRIPSAFSPYSAVAGALQGCLEVVLEDCLANTSAAGHDSPGILGDCITVARLLTILSFTPLRHLVVFSNWQTSPRGSENSRKQLQCILRHNTTRTRECAYHAAQLIAKFRKQTFLSHMEPFVLLVATLYLWAYIELAIYRPTPSYQSNGNHGSIVRIDQHMDAKTWSDWTERGDHSRPHIAGIGILDNSRGPERLLKEAARITAISATKSHLAASLSRMFISQSSGNMPVWEDDEQG